jgi:hypothetical protein
MSTFQTWVESIIVGVLIVIVFGIVVADFNNTYQQNNTIAGLETAGYQASINNFQSSLYNKTRGGEASFTSVVGLTLSTSWDIISSTSELIWGFISGQWIRTILVDYMKLPDIVGNMAQAIFFIAVGFIILKLLFKIKV